MGVAFRLNAPYFLLFLTFSFLISSYFLLSYSVYLLFLYSSLLSQLSYSLSLSFITITITISFSLSLLIYNSIFYPLLISFLIILSFYLLSYIFLSIGSSTKLISFRVNPYLLRLVFWNSIHLEVATDSLCFLINSSWLLVFIFIIFSFLHFFYNLYCWKGINFS